MIAYGIREAWNKYGGFLLSTARRYQETDCHFARLQNFRIWVYSEVN